MSGNFSFIELRCLITEYTANFSNVSEVPKREARREKTPGFKVVRGNCATELQGRLVMKHALPRFGPTKPG
jgi:hypothetical protein